MVIFRKIVVGFLIFWLTLPLPLFVPETAEEELTERQNVSVLFKKQKTQNSGAVFLNKININTKSIESMEPPLLIGGVIFDELLKINQYFQLGLFYFWQGLIKPTRQILWQMTNQMQRSLMKKMAGAYPKNKLFVYFDGLSQKIETVLDKQIH